jgi:hypothetical protein
VLQSEARLKLMQQYIPLKNKSATLGDAYYRCLSDTLTKPHAKTEFQECLRMARRYRAALRKQLSDLGRLKDPKFVAHERELTDRYLRLIEHDLDFFDLGEIEKLRKRRRPSFDQ